MAFKRDVGYSWLSFCLMQGGWASEIGRFHTRLSERKKKKKYNTRRLKVQEMVKRCVSGSRLLSGRYSWDKMNFVEFSKNRYGNLIEFLLTWAQTFLSILAWYVSGEWMISQDMLVTHMLCHALTTVNQKRIVCTLEYFFWVMPGLFVKF